MHSGMLTFEFISLDHQCTADQGDIQPVQSHHTVSSIVQLTVLLERFIQEHGSRDGGEASVSGRYETVNSSTVLFIRCTPHYHYDHCT